MNHILVFNVGNFWHPNARASVLAAAKRWGVSVREETSYPFGHKHPFRAKFNMHRLGWGVYDRILYLDADVIVRADCPNPFDIVDANEFGAVRNYQGDTHRGIPDRWHKYSWDEVCKDTGIAEPYRLDQYLNGGFLMWTAYRHDHVFETMRTFYGGEGKFPAGVVEQAAHSVSLAHYKTPVHWLPREFNRVGEAVWQSGPKMTAYVYHFAKYFDNRDQSKIGGIRWEETDLPVPSGSAEPLTANCGG